VADSWNWAGSKWWKFDFHTHTPASEDYGKGPNQTTLKLITPRDWLLNYMKAGIDCVAITDHNSGDWIDELKTGLKDLQTEKPEGYREIYLFPGVEISVQGGIHILGIFPEEKNKSDIDSLLGSVTYIGTHGKCDSCTEKSAIEVIKKIELNHGIAIPAHVDEEFAGLFKKFSGNTLGQILNSEFLFSMEVVNNSFDFPALYKEKKPNWTSVLGSDNHHPNNSDGDSAGKYPGSHFTWVKMSKPTIEGIRLALLDGNSLSIKRSDECTGNPNDFNHIVIEEIIVKDSKYIGRGDGREFSCRFNPWLNTIIGGRGTGKSSILEFIRLCLNRRDELPKALENDFEKYCQISTRGSDGLLTPDTKITLFIRKDGIRFKIIWDNDGSGVDIFQENHSGTWEIVEGDIKQRFPVRIFSQKQIFELSKDPVALLRIIDTAAEVGYREWAKGKTQLESQYLSLRAQIREKANLIKMESEIRGELDDIKNRLKIFEDTGYSTVLKNYSLSHRREDAITNWKNKWIDLDEKINHLCHVIVPQRLGGEDFTDLPEFQAIQDKIIADFIKVQEKIRDLTDEAKTVILEGDRMISKSDLLKQIAHHTQQYTDLKDTLEKEGIFDLTEYDALIVRKQALIQNLKNVAIIRKESDSLKKEAINCLKIIESSRNEISTKRGSFLTKLLSGNQSVSIQVLPFGDKENIESEFRKLIERDDGRFESDIGNLLQKLDDDPIMGPSVLKSAINKIITGDYSDIKDRRFGDYISRLDPEKIDRIMCYYPEDTLNVQYLDTKQNKFVSIEQGSPGQKNAALLAFLLIYGTEPLILDQPEDDLDNQLIYNSIVAQLKEIKRKRQVIVVTHNANVVVNGDSENVIPLYVDTSAQTSISDSNGLQDQSIRTKVCDILEGGKDAFESRYKRINV
jgi:ABC-type enterochelin transport system ATPase subunit/histidinol phosphatase-like PHP family hydrolase